MALIQQKEYEKPSEDTHNAVIVDIVDLGEVETKFGKKEKIRLIVQVEERGKDGKRLTTAAQFTPSLHKKAAFAKAVTGFLGKVPSMPFDTEDLYAQPLRVVIQHVEHEGKTYANIVAWMKPGKERLAPESYTRKQDRDDSQSTATVEDAPAPDDEGIPF